MDILKIGLVCMVLVACRPAPRIHTVEFLAMGTSVSIRISDPAPGGLARILADVESQMQRLGEEWYPWTPEETGELARLNTALALGQNATVSAELASLVDTAKTLASASGGRFDPAIGSLVELWSFNSGTRDTATPLPESAALASWRQDHPSYADLTIQGSNIASRHGGLKLDLGAFAAGVANALVTAGGNVHAVGTAPERPWRVAIRDPKGTGTLGWVDLKDGESIDTSGDYERFAVVGGQRIHHLLDPRTGQPSGHTAAVTVIAKNGTLADAAATALFIAGPEDWQEVATALGVRSILRIDRDGTVQITRAMSDRVQWKAVPAIARNLEVVYLR